MFDKSFIFSIDSNVTSFNIFMILIKNDEHISNALAMKQPSNYYPYIWVYINKT